MSGKKDKKSEQTEPIITPSASPKSEQLIPVIPPGNRFTSTARNIGAATFSSMAKQAESLVNGDNSIVFNSYNNHAVFRSARMDINDAVSIDITNKSINNVNAVVFNNNTAIQGISDGYTVNNQGAMVPLYDSNIALSTAFGYEYAQTTDNLRKDLNIEIERRKYDHSVLLSSFQQTSEACEHAVRMIHYINYNTEEHSMSVVIPYETEESQTLSYVDDMPSETITYGDIDTDPSTGIVEFSPRLSAEKTVLSINRDGVTIDGSAVISTELYTPTITADSTVTDTLIANNASTETLTLPHLMMEIPGGSFKHPYRGTLVEIPTTVPTEEDEKYNVYRIIGGVRGDTVINPNKGLGDKYKIPAGAHFDCDQPNIRKQDFANDTYKGNLYIGLTHDSSLAGMVVKLPLTSHEEVTPEAQLLMDMLGYSPSDSSIKFYPNPNFELVGYHKFDNVLFDTVSDTIELQAQYQYLYIDNEARVNDIYFTPQHTIVAVADTIEMPIDNIIPTVNAVHTFINENIESISESLVQYIIEQVAGLAETISFDLDMKQYLIEYNAAYFDYLMNSTGGLDGKETEFVMPENPRPGEIPDFSPPAAKSFDFPIWVNIRKWIMQGLHDSMFGKESQTYWNDCPNYDIIKEYLGFATCLGKISNFGSKWSWELFKGDTMTWNVGGSSLLSGNSIRFVLHSEEFSNDDNLGGYFCSGAAGMHTNNWVHIGSSSKIPDFNRHDYNNRYNLYCAGKAGFFGQTDFRALTNMWGDLSLGSTSTMRFYKGHKLVYNYSSSKPEEAKETTVESLMSRIETLEAENAELKNKVASLESDVAYIKRLLKHFTV